MIRKRKRLEFAPPGVGNAFVAFVVAVLFSSFHSPLAQAYNASRCAHHKASGVPEEKARELLARSRKACAEAEPKLAEYEKFFRGENAFGKRTDKIVAEGSAIVQDYVNKKAKGEFSQYGESGASTAINDYMAKMRAKRFELEKLDAELQKKSEGIRAGDNEVFQLIAPFDSKLNEVSSELRSKIEESQRFRASEAAVRKNYQAEVDRFNKNTSSEARSALQIHVSNAATNLEKTQLVLKKSEEEVVKLTKTVAQLRGGKGDIFRDTAAFRREVMADWNKEALKVRIARARIVVNDIKATPQEQALAMRQLEDAKAEIVKAQANTAAGVAAEANPSKDRTKISSKEELDKVLAAGKSEAGMHYREVNEAVEQAMKEGKTNVKVLSGKDAVEKTIQLAESNTKDNVDKTSQYFMGDDAAAKAQTNLRDTFQQVKDGPLKELDGMNATTINKGRTFVGYEPAEAAKATAQIEKYNSMVAKLSEAEQLEWQKSGMPLKLTTNDLSYKYKGRNGGYSVDTSSIGGDGWLTSDKIKDGWFSSTKGYLAQDSAKFQDRMGDNVAARIRDQSYLVSGSKEGMSYFESWKAGGTETFGQMESEWQKANREVEHAQQILASGAPRARGSIDPAVRLANAEEHRNAVGAESLRALAPTLGEVVAHSPESAKEVLNLVTVKPTTVLGRDITNQYTLLPKAFNGGDRWTVSESKHLWKEIALSTVGGPIGQAVVAQESGAKANYLTTQAQTYKLAGLNKAARDAQFYDTMNTALMPVAAGFTFTGQTMIAGSLYKAGKGAYFEASSAAAVAKTASTVERVAHVAELAAPTVEHSAGRVAEQGVTAIDNAPVPYNPPSKAGPRQSAPADSAPVSRAPESGTRVADSPTSRAVEPAPRAYEAPNVSSTAPRQSAAAGTPSPSYQAAAQAPRASQASIPAQASARVSEAGARADALAARNQSSLARHASSISDDTSEAARNIANNAANSAPAVERMAPQVAKVAQATSEVARQAAVAPASSSLARVANPINRSEPIAQTVAFSERNAKVASGFARPVESTAASSLQVRQLSQAETGLRTLGADVAKTADLSAQRSLAETKLQNLGSASQQGTYVPQKLAAAEKIGDRAAQFANANRRAEESLAGLGAKVTKNTEERAVKEINAVAKTPAEPAVASEKVAQVGPIAEKTAESTKAAPSAAEKILEATKNSAAAEQEVAKAGSFVEQAAKWAEPDSKVSRYLNHMANLTEIKAIEKANPSLFAEIARAHGRTAAAHAKYLDRRIRWFEHRLAEKYTIAATRMEQFREGVERGTIKPEDRAEYIQMLAKSGVVESHVARPLIVKYETGIREAFEAAARDGNATALKKALETWKVPENLSAKISEAWAEAYKSGEVAETAFRETVPFIARSLAEGAVLNNKLVPTVGKTFLENMGLFFGKDQKGLEKLMGPAYLLGGTTRRYVASPFRRMSQYFKGMNKESAKSISTMELDARLAAASIAADKKLASTLKDLDQAGKPANNVVAAEKAEVPPAGSLLAKAESYAGNIEARVQQMIAASKEKDPLKRQIEIEKAERVLLKEHEVSKSEVARLRKLVESGQITAATKQEIKAQSQLIAESKFLADKNVAPRVAQKERQLVAAIKNLAKDETVAVKELKALGLDEQSIESIVEIEKMQKGFFREQGGIQPLAASLILKSDASDMLGKNFALNTAERFRRWARGSKALGGALGMGIWRGGAWVANIRSEERIAARSEIRGLRAEYWGVKQAKPSSIELPRSATNAREVADAYRAEDLRLVALSGMVRGALESPEKSKAVFAHVEEALAQAGHSSERVAEVRSLIESDTALLRDGLKGNPRENATYVGKLLAKSGRIEDYKNLLEASAKQGSELENAQAKQLFARLSAADELGENNRIQKMAEKLKGQAIFVMAEDQPIYLREIEALKVAIKNEHGELSEGAVLEKLQAKLWEKFPDRKIAPLLSAKGEATNLGARAIRGESDLELSFSGVAARTGLDSKRAKKVEGAVGIKGDKKFLQVYYGADKRGQIGGESVVAHEGTHLDSFRLGEQLDGIEERLRKGIAEEAANLKQRSAYISSRSGLFNSRYSESTLVNTADGYEKFYAYDEVYAHLAQAKKEIALARLVMSKGTGSESKLRAAASLAMAEEAIQKAQAMALANRRNLNLVREELAKNGTRITYDPDSGNPGIIVTAAGGSFSYSLKLPQGISEETALIRMREAVGYALGEAEKEIQSTVAYLGKESDRLSGRLDSRNLGKTTTTEFRDEKFYTKSALAQAAPSVREAVALREVREAQLSDQRRLALASADSAARFRLLSEEEHYLAKNAALAEAEAREARAAASQSLNGKLEKVAKDLEQKAAALKRDHAAVAAQLAGERAAKTGTFAGTSAKARQARRNYLRDSRREMFESYLPEHFPGQTLEQVTSDPKKVRQLRALRAVDLAQAQQNARQAKEAGARALEQSLPGARGQGARMAQDLEAAHALAAGAKNTAEREKLVADALKARDWSSDQLAACAMQGICVAKLEARPASVIGAEASLLARQLILDSEVAKASMRVAEEARGIAKLPEENAGKTFSAMKRELDSQKNALAQEAKEKEKLLKAQPENTAIAQTAADVKRAQKVVLDRLSYLKKNESTLSKAEDLSPQQVTRSSGAVSAVTKFLESPESKTLFDSIPALRSAKLSIENASSGEAKLIAYQKFYKAVSALEAKEQAQVFRAVEAHSKEGTSVFSEALRKADALKEESLAVGIAKSEEAGRATNSRLLSRAAAGAEIKNDEQLALAEALGVVKGPQSEVERAAALGVKAKTAEAEAVEISAKTEALNAKAKGIKGVEGRILASNTRKSVMSELEGLAALKGREDTARAIAESVAKFEQTEAGAAKMLTRFKQLAETEPDEFEVLQMAYVKAAYEFASKKAATRELAWEQGVRQMLLEQGYKAAKDLKPGDVLKDEDNLEIALREFIRCRPV